MARYDVKESWDDPFEHHDERRTAPRYRVRLKLSIEVDSPERGGRLHGPGIVRDISHTGTRLVTKHELTPGQRVSLDIPTASAGDEVCLPESFAGSAEVLRVERGEGGCAEVVFRFGENLFEDMEFALFLESSKRAAREAATAKGLEPSQIS